LFVLVSSATFFLYSSTLASRSVIVAVSPTKLLDLLLLLLLLVHRLQRRIHIPSVSALISSVSSLTHAQ
jgi:hypothetical protein